jgi:hypothetical protein
MKKMIPVYLLQLAMLGAFLFVSLSLLAEVRALKAELIDVKGSFKDPISVDDTAIRVKVINSVHVTQ